MANTALCTPLMLAFGIAAARAADFDLYQPTPIGGSLPAVSAINGKLDIAVGGSTPGYGFDVGPTDFESAFRVQGALSVPLGHAFGLQTDGVFASIQGSTFGHVAAHAFWRDPAVGLAGVYAAYSVWDSINRGRVAFEGEAYFGRFSAETITGAEFGDVPNSMFTITDLAYYPTDNFRISVGVRHNSAGNALAGGLEYQFASGPKAAWSAFADGEIGDYDYQRVFAGVRLYLGADKSLIRRHREDDPAIKSDERSLTACGQGAIVSDGLQLPQAAPVLSDSILGFCGPIPD